MFSYPGYYLQIDYSQRGNLRVEMNRRHRGKRSTFPSWLPSGSGGFSAASAADRNETESHVQYESGRTLGVSDSAGNYFRPELRRWAPAILRISPPRPKHPRSPAASPVEDSP